MTKATRFISIKDSTEQNITQLDEKGFITLPDAINNYSEGKPILLVDIKNRNYWKVDILMLKSNATIIRCISGEEIKAIESEELKDILN